MKNIEKLSPFHGQYAYIRMKGLKEGLIDRSGSFVIPPIYDSLYLSGNLVVVGVYLKTNAEHDVEDLWGVINLKNEVVIPLEYAAVDIWECGTVFSIWNSDGCWGAINAKGDVIIPFEFDFLATPDQFGLIFASKNGKRGWLDANGKVVIELIYDDVDWVGIGPAIAGEPWTSVRIGDQWFYIDQTGKRVLL